MVRSMVYNMLRHMEGKRYKVCAYRIPECDAVELKQWLTERFPVEFLPQRCWQEADFLITDTFDYAYERFNGVRILYTREYHPVDLSFFDYCVTHDVKESDRCLYFPYWAQVAILKPEFRRKLEQPRPQITAEELKAQGKKFCSFICRNTAAKRRVKLVKELMKHKTVSCGGPLMNNVGGPVEDKIVFQKEHLFSMAYENEAAPGYQTEKIVDAYVADSIPLYWGNPYVEEIFNPKSFVNDKNFKTMDEMVRYVIDLSEDYERMAQMLREPIFVDPDIMQKTEKALYDFFARIFERGPGAIQRTRWQRFHAGLTHFYGHGLFRTIRRISRAIRGKKNVNGVSDV